MLNAGSAATLLVGAAASTVVVVWAAPGCGLLVAEVVGGDAVEAVRVAVLTREGCRRAAVVSVREAGEWAAVVGDVDVVRGDADAVGVANRTR